MAASYFVGRQSFINVKGWLDVCVSFLPVECVVVATIMPQLAQTIYISLLAV